MVVFFLISYCVVFLFYLKGIFFLPRSDILNLEVKEKKVFKNKIVFNTMGFYLIKLYLFLMFLNLNITKRC